MNLTAGAISMLSSGQALASEMKPVLQVTDVRLVNPQSTAGANGSNERYRLVLSDGAHLQQGMLATQLNDLVKFNRLQKGSIVLLTQFVCNLIQNRIIIIIIDLEVIAEECDIIGEPRQLPQKMDSDASPVARSSAPVQPVIQPGPITSNSQSFSAGPGIGGSLPKPNIPGNTRVQPPVMDRTGGPHSYGSSFANNQEPGRFNATTAASPKPDSGLGPSRTPTNNYVRPPQTSFQQPNPVFSNRGPIAKNEAPPRIIPIAALNPYQGRWTIKARVTAKGELRHYNNPRGDGKVFSFDLLDSDGGEIRVTCFNTVADQFYSQIEPGKVYMISKGLLKPAQKSFNHLRNDHEIFLESTSIVQPCFEDDRSIPQQQFHFCSIRDIEGMDNNSVIDVIGVVSSISPSSSIMRKNGTEIQKRSLQLKDMSGRSVELTMWGQFCNAEGETLQSKCDSGVFPVLAVKSGRVNDFNGKAIGTISSSQLLIEPDFPEAHKLKAWFEQEGKNTPSISISRETVSMGRTDVRKAISQIKDERLGTSEKPDWITVCATLTFIKSDNFCYTACPIMIGDRQCSKKVINNGDGKWRCDRCDQTVDECDYRYILQFQIQDHTGLTWVTAFQECGEEILGISAKELYNLKYEEQDDDRFAEIVRGVLFNKYMFKLKVKEETYSDEQRVKSTIVKAEKVNFQSETKYLLDLIAKMKGQDLGSLPLKTESGLTSGGQNSTGFGSGIRETANPVTNYGGGTNSVKREFGGSANQTSPYGNQYGGSRPAAPISSGMYLSCNSCGGTGHSSTNCPSIMNGQTQSYGGGNFGHRVGPEAASSGGASGDCFKCHQPGHWARDCPGVSNVPPAYGNSKSTPSGYGNFPRQHVGGF